MHRKERNRQRTTWRSWKSSSLGKNWKGKSNVSVFKPKYRDNRGKLVESKVYWFEFIYASKRIRESAKTTRKTIAVEAEKRRRLELERAYAGLPVEAASMRISTVLDCTKAYRAS